MLKLPKIAITGGVASGKTTVCQFFQELGACVVFADAIVHELLNPDTDLGQQIIQLLGTDVLENEKFNRRTIAEKVFKDPRVLERLEKLLHPAVLQQIEKLYSEACRKGSYTSFVVEIPLLFEIQGERFYDVIVAVLSEESLARTRFEKAGFQNAEYDRRMKRQLKPHQKSARAHFTITNNGSLEDLHNEVIKLNQIIHNLPNQT